MNLKEGLSLEKEMLFQRAKSMIMSSSKNPKYMSISTVKVADIFGVNPLEVEEGLKELVNEGRLQKAKLQDPPHNDIYLLPNI
jgi:hypothetical protein